MPVFVPPVRQAYDYSCGAASLASCLYYWGVWDGREPELYPLLKTNEDGTKGKDLMEVAQRFNLQVYYRDHLSVNDLSSILEEGYTAILNIQAWGNYTADTNFEEVWEDGHYVVLVNVINGRVILMDPGLAGRYGSLSIEQLNERWHDWNDDGSRKEYHTAILLKGERIVNLTQPFEID